MIVAVFARELVMAVYGETFADATLVVQLLALVTLRTLTNFSVGSVFVSHGRSDLQFRWAIFSNVIATACLICGARWGVAGIAGAFVGLGFIGWVVSHTMANAVLGLTFSDLGARLARPALALGAFALSLTVLRAGLQALDATATRTLMLAVVPAAVLYGAILWAIAPAPTLAIVNALRSSRPTAPAITSAG